MPLPAYVVGSNSATYLRITPPDKEPISLDEAKQHSRIGDHYSDDLVSVYLQSAREYAEEYLGYGLYTQTWRLELGGFRDVMELPMALVLQNDPTATPSTAVQIQYYGLDGTLLTLDPTLYLIDPTSRPARITRAPNKMWPSIQPDRITGCVRITYVVGWTRVEDIPQRIKQGIRGYITYLDADRDGLEPNAMQALQMAQACWSDRMFWTPPYVWTPPYLFGVR